MSEVTGSSTIVSPQSSALQSKRLNPARWLHSLDLLGVSRVVVPILAFIAIGRLMFEGSLGDGMEFDEVFRVNNIVPVINPAAEPYNQAISSLHVLGISIPLMYKQYISSAFLIQYLPLHFFDNYLVGIRALNLIYLVSVAIFSFLIFRKKSYWVALLVTVCAMFSPLLYPDVRYGFVSVTYLALLSGSYWFFERYRTRGSSFSLFWASFFLFFSVNLTFYVAWVAVALILTIVVLFPDILRRLLTSFQNVLALGAGFLLGLFNYVYYNATNSFPTFMTFVNRIFFPDRYAKNPIDFRQPTGLWQEASRGLRLFYGFLGPFAEVYAVGLVVALAVTCVGLGLAIRRGQFLRLRVYFVPSAVLLITGMLILVSPNTTRRGHYSMLVVWMELTFIAAFLLVRRLFFRNPNLMRAVSVSISLLLVGLYALTSGISVVKENETRGNGFFSAAIFDLNGYLVSHGISSKNTLQVQWGSYAQLYFLSRGEWTGPNVVFQILGAQNDAARRDVIDAAVEDQSTPVFVPVYVSVGPVAGVDVRELLVDLSSEGRVQICTAAVFKGDAGVEAIRLYRVSSKDATTGTVSGGGVNVPCK